MRFHAMTCSGLYIPVQPGLMRPSRLTSVISAMTSAAPPTAREPRFTRCQSFGVPSSAEYWHMGETTIRFDRSTSRSRKGVNMGGGAGAAATATRLCCSALDANQRSTDSTNFGSRSFRLSWVTRTLDVRPPLLLVGDERLLHLVVTLERAAERDRVLHRELRPRADREVRGVRRVADQHDVPVMPGPVLHRREVAPERAVLEEAVALELLGDQHEVGAGVRAEVGHLVLEAEDHAELRAAALQDVEQELA